MLVAKGSCTVLNCDISQNISYYQTIWISQHEEDNYLLITQPHHINLTFQWVIYCVTSFRGPSLHASCREIQSKQWKGLCKPQFTQSLTVVFWLCLFLCISRPPSAAVSQCTDRTAQWEPALDYKAQICLGTHGSELSNKTWISPRHNGFVSQCLGKQMERKGVQR